jgi:hypothetical protein
MTERPAEEISEEISDTGYRYQVIRVPNLLRAKTGPLRPTSALCAKADAALSALCAARPTYVAEVLRAITAEWASIARDGKADRRPLVVALHEMRGLAGNFGYPAMAEIAAEAAPLLEGPLDDPQLVTVVDAHIQSLMVVLAQKPSDTGAPAMQQLLTALRDARAKLQDAGGAVTR